MENPYHVKRTRNKLYLLEYCIILTTAEDRDIFRKEDARVRCLEYMQDTYDRWECRDTGSYVLDNALGMKFDAPPTLNPVEFTNAFKTKSAVRMKEAEGLWNTGYFITTMGSRAPEKRFFEFYEELKAKKNKGKEKQQ